MSRPMRVCHWTQAIHVAVHRLLTDVAALRTEEGKPWGASRLAAELLREIEAREVERTERESLEEAER